jgi:hypothetical protein
MKTKASVSIKKQPVTVKDLKATQNPKGGMRLATLQSQIQVLQTPLQTQLTGASGNQS